MTATINPSNSSNKKVTWKSSNTKIATVSSTGIVKGIKNGTVYIYVYTVDGKKSARCKVVVIDGSNNHPKDYIQIGSNLEEETLIGMFGKPEKNIVASVEKIIKVLGNPIKKTQITYGSRWYFKQGIEIDVINMSDYLIINNYVYISPLSKIRTNRNIGIESTRKEVLEAYKEEINPHETNNGIIVAGRKSIGVIFEMKNDKVNSIYIGTGRFIVGRSTLEIFWRDK